MLHVDPKLDRAVAERYASFVASLQVLANTSASQNTPAIPEFPHHRLSDLARMLCAVDRVNHPEFMQFLFPHRDVFPAPVHSVVDDAFQRFQLTQPPQSLVLQDIGADGRVTLYDTVQNSTHHLNLPVGPLPRATSSYVSVPSQARTLAGIALSSLTADVCVVGPRGSGKSVVVDYFARVLG
jgi:hypothetical protein